MAKLLPKIMLDNSILGIIVEYFKIDVSSKLFESENLLDLECFSHPGLETHDCNIRAKLPGNHKCSYCEHTVGKHCTLSCDLQNICLASFAYRMGVGGEDMEKAIKSNLYDLTNIELYDKVIEKFGNEFNSVSSNACISGEMPDTYNQEQHMVDGIENTGDLLTIKDAATYYGCTYANIYNYVKSGKLSAVENGTKQMVRKADLDTLKSLPKARRGRKPGSKNAAAAPVAE
jgi:excisionase family DNA binding protein